MTSIIRAYCLLIPFVVYIMQLFSMKAPSHSYASPVSHIYPDVFVTELLYLCDIGVLDICGTSQRVSPK